MTLLTSAATSRPGVLVLAETPHSAPVTHVGDRVGWVIGLLIVIGLLYWLMRQGWQWRKTQQSGLPELLPVPKHSTEAVLELQGRYFGTTSAGDWLERVVARRLGERSLVELTLTAEGLDVVRPASASFFVPIGALRAARTDRGIAGKVVPEGGLLVVTWEHGGRLLDTGFRADHPQEHEQWVTAVEVLLRAHAKVTGGTTATGTPATGTTATGTATDGTTGGLPGEAPVATPAGNVPTEPLTEQREGAK